MQTTKVVRLLPKQLEFISSKKKEVLYSGGYASGKSLALCYALAQQASIPNNSVLLARKTLVSLKRSTLISLIGHNDPVLPRGSYTYRPTEGTISLNGGGTIHLASLENIERIRSMNLGFIALDEGSELNENEYLELLYRLRLDQGSRQLVTATNPSGRSHWMYRRFFKNPNNDRTVITASSLENKFLPKDYVKSLKGMELSRYKKFVEGQWINLEGMIYSNFNRSIHVKRLLPSTYESYYIGIDMGTTHPCAILVIGRNGERLYVLEECYKTKMLISEILKQIEYYCKKYDYPVIVYDPAAATLGNELSNAGFKVLKANNDVNIGILRVKDLLEVKEDGLPNLLINEDCVNLLNEFENYQWKEDGTEKPVKELDDALDVLRYITNYIADNKSSSPRIFFGDDCDSFDD